MKRIVALLLYRQGRCERPARWKVKRSGVVDFFRLLTARVEYDLFPVEHVDLRGRVSSKKGYPLLGIK
jgi:hypothetical protein